MEIGFHKTDNEAAYTNTVENVTTIDYNLSNRFLYDEWIHAAYLNYSKSFGTIEFQLGLRAETTTLKGAQLGNVEQPGSEFSRTYHNLFPTFCVVAFG
ncbi:MAG: outer membrane beta-barrel protein [Haliscomenobacter sp.]|nr:outer membrane beta-barrel protein [Haliscomenobacter sp.]